MKKYAIIVKSDRSLGIATALVAKENNYHVCVEADTKEEAKEILRDLKERPQL